MDNVVSAMRSVMVDKLASVTQACGLSHEVRISPDIPAEEGVVVVVEVLNNKSTYNTLELTSGRMAKVNKGDIVCRVLGVALHFPYLGERIGVPARVGSTKLDYDAKLDTKGVPIVALAGTCME